MKNMKEKVADFLGITGIVMLVIFLLIVGPIIGIWCINTLFHANTPYNFWTWLAALLFFALCRK